MISTANKGIVSCRQRYLHIKLFVATSRIYVLRWVNKTQCNPI